MAFSINTTLLDPVTLDKDGIFTGRSSSFGIGTLLVLKCNETNRVLMGRKSFREGFEGSNQFTFPGGMLRSAESVGLETCIEQTLEKRVLEETGISMSSLDTLAFMGDWPPVVARYTIGGTRKVAAAILPFYGEVTAELLAESNDPTVYAAGWYDPLSILEDITRTNSLILAQALWHDFTSAQQARLQQVLAKHFEDAVSDAALVGAVAPMAAWKS